VVYALPLSVVLLAFPPRTFHRPQWQLSLAWGSGGLLALLAVRLAYGSGGAWEAYLSVFRGLTGTAGDVVGFKPWNTLGRLLWQTPLLLALTLAACCVVATELIRRRKAGLSWEGDLPEAMLLAGALAALMINPTPFPYNLIHIVPYAFLLAYRYADALWRRCRDRTQLLAFAAALVVLVHFVPFVITTKRHSDQPNARQHMLMRLAEDMTDPKKDPVYDAAGMVPTRRSVHYRWFLHSLNIRDMVKNPGSRVRDMLAARPAAVFIPSYRTDWLPPEDHDFIEERYVSLADDFWVLGSVLPAGGGDFEIFHPGRYRIVRLKPAVFLDTERISKALALDEISVVGTLNGTNISNEPVALSLGVHRIETPADGQIGVIWVGPRLDTVPRVSPGRHATLFWNWY
jgi:hypothetical protein